MDNCSAEKWLSVVVPAYNLEKYLSKCLSSLIVSSDRMEGLEVLVVNDGSKDRTSEIAHDFAARYPETFTVIDKGNGNYGSCVNAALPVVKGRYVRILDADDYVNTDAFAKSLDVLRTQSSKGDEAVDLLVALFNTVDEQGRVIDSCDYQLGEEGEKSLGEVPESCPRFTVHSIAYKTANLRRMHYRQTEGISYTDTEWIIEPMTAVKRFYYLPCVVTNYLLGRVGQTAERTTFARNFQQVATVTLNLARHYDGLALQAAPDAKDYYVRQVRKMVSNVYRLRLFGMDGTPVVCDLRSFDEALKSNPSLYAYAEGQKVTSWIFSFSFVSEWRQKHSRMTIKFLFFFLCLALGRLKRSML